jgi:hypothetical protein
VPHCVSKLSRTASLAASLTASPTVPPSPFSLLLRPSAERSDVAGGSPTREFDLESFNTGDYVSAILDKQRAETLSAVLYPDDRTYQGRELRLKQQHFLVSATLQVSSAEV